jgi:hypothetical protein
MGIERSIHLRPRYHDATGNQIAAAGHNQIVGHERLGADALHFLFELFDHGDPELLKRFNELHGSEVAPDTFREAALTLHEEANLHELLSAEYTADAQACESTDRYDAIGHEMALEGLPPA